MKFIPLAAMIMSVALIAGADDPGIIGHPCAQAGYVECGSLPNYNSGHWFMFWCGPDYTITAYQDCDNACWFDEGHPRCY
ncbi:hypothetical protein K503DRAFT_774067 [Rhizopogon vinicolor AM-OR11-026]|uniref:CBM1 domain-containing protein n=1 Tax=Rhizopogon vinicolor AM-OR11-026 TaxID=1314800 RepID=A0A1B7MQL8_9AGAM|nr:hypothetical protein K503DRAFT_774067 [Rhizopogon vinicolor AM-OR11-026]